MTEEKCTCVQHDTNKLPRGAYFFAPGVIEGGPATKPHLRRMAWGGAAWRMLGCALLVALVAGAAACATVWLGAML
jgi:hypothetical protein